MPTWKLLLTHRNTVPPPIFLNLTLMSPGIQLHDGCGCHSWILASLVLWLKVTPLLTFVLVIICYDASIMNHITSLDAPHIHTCVKIQSDIHTWANYLYPCRRHFLILFGFVKNMNNDIPNNSFTNITEQYMFTRIYYSQQLIVHCWQNTTGFVWELVFFTLLQPLGRTWSRTVEGC